MRLLVISTVLAVATAQTIYSQPAHLILYRGQKADFMQLSQKEGLQPVSSLRPGGHSEQSSSDSQHTAQMGSAGFQQSSVGFQPPPTTGAQFGLVGFQRVASSKPGFTSSRQQHDDFQRGFGGSHPGVTSSQQQVSEFLRSSIGSQPGSISSQLEAGDYQRHFSATAQQYPTSQQGFDRFQQGPGASHRVFTSSQRRPSGLQQDFSDSQLESPTSRNGMSSFKEGSSDPQQEFTSSQMTRGNSQLSSTGSQSRFPSSQSRLDSSQQGFSELQKEFTGTQQKLGSRTFQPGVTRSQQESRPEYTRSHQSGLQQGSSGFEQEIPNTQQRPDRFQEISRGFQQEVTSNQQMPGNFQQMPGNFQQASSDDQQEFTSTQQRPSSFQQGPKRVPDSFQQEFTSARRTSDTFQQDSSGPMAYSRPLQQGHSSVQESSSDSQQGSPRMEGDSSRPQHLSRASPQTFVVSQRTSDKSQQRFTAASQKFGGDQRATGEDSVGFLRGITPKLASSAFQSTGDRRKNVFRPGFMNFQTLSQQASLNQFQQTDSGRQSSEGPRFKTSADFQFGPLQPGLPAFSENLEDFRGMFEPLNLPSGATHLLGDISSSFSCVGQPYGYYADQENSCRVFHVCYPALFSSGRVQTYQYSFMCSEGSVFDQMEMTCVQEANAIPCSASSLYFSRNTQFGLPRERTAALHN